MIAKNLLKRCFLILFFVVTVVLNAASAEVWYIYGWYNELQDQKIPVSMLEKFFPGSPVTLKEWKANGKFVESKERADIFARHLATEIVSLPQERRENLILVGHSLGGRIAVRCIAELSRRGIAVRQAIFLGAAIPDDDPDCLEVFRQTLTPCINVFCPKDNVLVADYGTVGEGGFVNALGANGIRVGAPHRQYRKDSPADHKVEGYLACLQKRIGTSSDAPEVSDIHIPYAVKKPIKLPSDRCYTRMESCNNWRLYRSNLKNDWIIVDPMQQIRACGSEEKMRESFEVIKRQLDRDHH